MNPRVFAVGGVLAALAASSCCVAPLVLVSMGVGGAWMGGLAALAPYQPLFLGGAMLFLGSGFWLVYGRPRGTCPVTVGSRSAQLVAGFLGIKSILWLGTAIIAATLGFDFGLPIFL